MTADMIRSNQLREIDHLGREAMSGQVMVRKWADSLAAGDPFLADDLRFFVDIVKIGKGEIIAETINTFTRRSCR
jgi:hypothetical protein